MKKFLLSSLIILVIFVGIDNVNAAACYMCGTSNSATYSWADSNPNSNNCSKTSKTESECSGSSSYNKNASSAKTVSCGDSTDIPAALPVLISNLINAVKILVPIMLIILGMLDFTKASMAADDKAISESKNKFVKRTISAVAVFLVVTVVQLGFSFLGDKGNDATACLDCFINGDC